ncbi:cysteine--1-D-myo-inosityl 2-amino-2-deoxy-alpha-D-glucopyranoside ligase [Nocardia farcinica]|uniref:cysteine--1-D-myo-inosityl 2-amino-2-deoxy-alpha-D-glucopyranoside ligase n=1 Tax=Nocardia farcinica TaxID=37329 RepID=UPI001895D75E|nr:cysteine--1-D-myo-inosityl 2-amino-2-deoxy-alpha-D-glucopyranoside ligase [Nocardia farcinica]MBF6234799.1 cysteine--1-D-myo-inosityl 2-amino-2-deoxy-alpha-D-glucopyranoside ligase [Nocardia farcinica]MBF6260642.1 cysteine--1-D-myo-inosityl 2-amino-2-deoxy-alpha-D-glucopyranoside ligase [Nocardia farcinica]MBF6279688.1 cysteine--1-D-myo-inosityl 2-amino-2-deoxy-alpha-D-glucopyranoside ligase [Nocardia farcinica]MBF6303652.1 cysteine--1-D-myo-inosityl 2-amino-2-deoxy-alpha-D-glucopyranoside l
MQSWSDTALPTVPGAGPPLRLYDTADRQVRPVAPGATATMYVCGITPYDATHLGHAATYLTFDLVNRVLRDGGHDVHYVQNVTDVDDPLFERAARDGVDWRELGSREIELFRTDMTALRVLPPREYVGAVESVEEVVEFVQKLLATGAAYVVDDPDFPDIYFRTDATEQFGYESGYDRSTMERLFAERGGDPDRPGKRDPLDALLWRAARPGEPSWPAPFGAGRPGWHIECSAIALNRLGPEFDIQGGGSDLIYPHHEYSAAHAESVVAGRRFARHYVHAGLIGLDGEKMSKSRGNLVLVSTLRKDGVDPAAIRLGLLDGHYRQDRMWTDAVLEAALARLARWRSATALSAGPAAHDTIARLRQHLADDLDSPKALAAVDNWVTEALDYGGSDSGAPAAIAEAVDALLGVRL